MPKWKTTIAQRFWEKVDIRTPDECWPWKGAGGKGHGLFWNGSRYTQASRVAWTLAHGPIPDGLWVLHHCDNRPCVNVRHLFLGTHRDNVTDCVAKGRQLIGSQKPQSKLTEDMVRQIRNDPRSHAEIAKEYGVSRPAITHARGHLTWKHVL